MWPGKSNLSLLKKNCWNNDQYFKCFIFQIIELEGKVLTVFKTLIIFFYPTDVEFCIQRVRKQFYSSFWKINDEKFAG